MNVREHPKPYIFDDRSPGYRMTGDILVHVAERCGLDADSTTRLRWRESMGLLRDFDTYADEIAHNTNEAMLALGDFALFAATYPSLTPEKLPPKTRYEMIRHTQIVLETGTRIANETDMNQFIELRKLEAYHTVQILGAAATKYVHQQDNFNLCMWRFTGFGIGANLMDSAFDAYQDYEKGKIKIPPSPEFYKRLVEEAWRHAQPHLHTAIDAKGLGLRAGIIYRRLTNRIQKGRSPYSNINLLRGQ